MSVSFATHRPTRLAGLFLLYAAQGIPEGLLYIAVPAWLAVNGASPEAIGGYIAIILLPWGFKMVNGVLMDRIAYLPMGRRRPWLIAAQAALVFTLLLFGAEAPDVNDLAAITAAGFLVNLAGAFQDVAIDGMAIDVVPDDERARANGVMWGGKILGTAGASVVTGAVIATHGFSAAATMTAACVAFLMLVPLLVRERPGERLAPWSQGEASAQSVARQLHGWLPIGRALGRAMTTPTSILLAIGIFIALSGYGLETAFGPVLAVTELGFTELTYGELTGTANMIGGLFGIFLCGILADRLGARRALVLSLIGMGVLQGAMAASPESWGAPGVFRGYTILYILLFVLMSVSLYAEAMRVSTPAIAATQFSLFMAVLNLGTSFGAQRFGTIQQNHGFEGAFLAAGSAALIAAIIFLASREKPALS
ncbi:MAG: MFS transporter [Halioglobus sp.]|nr:MFS transporter [Halioglobus sp.]